MMTGIFHLGCLELVERVEVRPEDAPQFNHIPQIVPASAVPTREAETIKVFAGPSCDSTTLFRVDQIIDNDVPPVLYYVWRGIFNDGENEFSHIFTDSSFFNAATPGRVFDRASGISMPALDLNSIALNDATRNNLARYVGDDKTHRLDLIVSDEPLQISVDGVAASESAGVDEISWWFELLGDCI